MAIICPNFNNPDVAREFNELKLAIGEKAAYAVWSLNNGNGIESAPDGSASQLFQDLLNYYGGDRAMAIRAKAMAYGNSYRSISDWLNGPFTQEPNVNDVVSNYYSGTESDFNDIVADNNVNEMYNIPHVDATVHKAFLDTVNTTGMTQDEIDKAERKFYAEQYQISLRGAIVNLAKNMGFRARWVSDDDVRLKSHTGAVKFGKYVGSALMGAGASAIAAGVISYASFGLLGGTFVLGAAAVGATAKMLFDKNNFSSKMRELFLKTMIERFSNPHYSKYALQVVSSLYNDDYLSPEINIRSVALIYVDAFWNDDLVQTAVQQIKELHPDMKISLIKKEVVESIVDNVDGKSLISKIKNGILSAISRMSNKSLRSVIFNKTCSHIAKAMCCHDYLTNIKKDAIFKSLRKYGSFNKGATIDYNEKTIIDSFIALNKARLRAIKLYSNLELREDEIRDYENRITQLESVDVENINEVNQTIILFIHSAYNELAEAIDWLDNNRDVTSDDFDKTKMNEIRDNIIKGYQHILNDFIQPYSSNLNCDVFVRTEIDELNKTLFEAIAKFQTLENEWADEWIQDYVEYTMRGQFDNYEVETANGITNATTVARENAKLSLHNKIRKTGLANWFGKKIRLFGAIDKSLRSANYHDSVVMNAIDHLIRYDDEHRNKRVQKKKNKLVNLYKKALKLLDKILPKDFFNTFLEHDGKAKTANFVSPVNVGQYENELHAFLQKLFENEVKPLIKKLKYLQQRVDQIEDGTASSETFRIVNEVLAQCGRRIDIVSYLRNTEISAEFDNYEYTFDSPDILINTFWQNQIDTFNTGRKHKRYTAEYYTARRKVLSPDTEAEYEELSNRISAIRQKSYNKELKFYDSSKLSPQDKAKLKQLEFLLEQLSNPYDITINARGEIVSAVEKTGDAARMAEELRRWSEIRMEHVRYTNNDERFEEVRQHMEDVYGRNSSQYIQFMAENTHWKEDEDIHNMLPDTMDEELKRLMRKKNYILKYAKQNPKAYEHPDLGLLSYLTLELLKAIDEEIAEYIQNNPQNSSNIDEDILEEYHRLTWTENAINPNTNIAYINELRMKYGARAADVLYYTSLPMFINEPLSIFTRRIYDDSIVHMEYSNQFQDYKGDWVDTEWQEEDDFMNVDRDRYKNKDFDKIQSDPNLKAFYDELISTMDEIWDMYPKHRRHYRYQMPLMTQEGIRRTLTQSRPSGLKTKNTLQLHFSELFSDITNPDENSDDFVEQFLIKPDGSVMESVPMRYIKPLKGDSWAVDTDIIKTVTMMYDAALSFSGRKEVEQAALMLQDVQAGSFLGMLTEDQINTHLAIGQYMSSKLYGNNKQKAFKINGTNQMSSFERFAWKLSRQVQSLTAKAFLNWNLTSWGKNALDSSFAMFNVALAGFKLRFKDVFKGIGQLISDFPQASFNPSNASSKSWTAAAMQFHNVHEGAEYSAAKQSLYWVRRFINQFFLLGPFTLIDYTCKGVIVNATYNHYKLMTDPITHKLVFLSKQQAYRRFVGVNGMKKSDVKRMYNKANTTLHDAYYVDSLGNFTVKPQFKDIINPILTKNFDQKLQTKTNEIVEEAKRRFENSAYVYDEHGTSKEDLFVNKKINEYIESSRDNLFETEVTGRINELASVVNGMFTKYKDTKAVSNVIGSMFFLMRGWFVTQYNDHFKDGNTFSEHKLKDGAYQAAQPTNMSEEDILGKFNMATGELERGDMIGNFESGIGKIFAGPKAGIKQLKTIADYMMRLAIGIPFMLNMDSKYSWTNNLTEHEKYQLKASLGIVMIMLFNILSSKYTCNLVRETDKQYTQELTVSNSVKAVAANYLYTIQAGVQAELISKFSRFGVMLSMIDFVSAPFTTTGYINDLGTAANGVIAASTLAFDECFGTNSYESLGYDEKITRFSAFLGMSKGEAAIVGSTALLPGVQDFNYSNLYKSTTVNGLRSKQAFAMKQSAIPLLGKQVKIPGTETQFNLFGKYLPFYIYKPYGVQTGLIPHLIEGDDLGVESPYVKSNKKSNSGKELNYPKNNSRGGSRGGGRSSSRGGGRGGGRG